MVENVGDGEEEVALFLVREAVLAAEAVLLGDAREAKGLAGKAAAENVMGRDVFDIDLVDIACRLFAEVGGVGLAAEPVPVAGEDAPRPRPLEGEAEPANAAEEVDESQNGEGGMRNGSAPLTGSRVHPFEQFRRGKAEGLGQLGDVLDAGIPQPALDAGDVGGVEARPLGELFLGQLPRLPAATEVLPEGGKDGVTFRHD